MRFAIFDSFVYTESYSLFLLKQVWHVQEQSKSEAEKLIADMTSLVSNSMCRQKEMVLIILLRTDVCFLFLHSIDI